MFKRSILGLGLSLFTFASWAVTTQARLAALTPGSAAHSTFLQERYGFRPDEIHQGTEFPIIFRNRVPTPSIAPEKLKLVVHDEVYDTFIVGGGMASMTSALFISEAGHRVMIAEKSPELGGLGASTTRNGMTFARGSAYFAGATRKIFRIFQKISMGNYLKRHTILPYIDSFYYNGQLFEDVWEHPTDDGHLPYSFLAVKFALLKLERDDMIADQPFEADKNRPLLDSMSFEEWVRSVPAQLETWASEGNHRAKEVLELLQSDLRVNPLDPMADPLKLLNIYGRSAGGAHASGLSSALGTNFYVEELHDRYTGPAGAGEVSRSLETKLRNRPTLVEIQTGAEVVAVRQTRQRDAPTGGEVDYRVGDTLHRVRAREVIWAAPVGRAVSKLENFAKMAPEAYKVASEMRYTDYMVINVHVLGHPWTKAYDLWVYDDKTYSKDGSITDIVDGRRLEFQERPRTDDKGVLTIYFPLSEKVSAEALSNEKIERLAQSGVDQMLKFLNPLIKKDGGKEIQVLAVEANYWKDAIHIAEKGHFGKAAALVPEIGSYFHFANNNMGTPSVEEALYRGWITAERINQQLTTHSHKPRTAKDWISSPRALRETILAEPEARSLCGRYLQNNQRTGSYPTASSLH